MAGRTGCGECVAPAASSSTAISEAEQAEQALTEQQPAHPAEKVTGAARAIADACIGTDTVLSAGDCGRLLTDCGRLLTEDQINITCAGRATVLLVGFMRTLCLTQGLNKEQLSGARPRKNGLTLESDDVVRLALSC